MTDTIAAAGKAIEEAVLQVRQNVEDLAKAQQEQFEKATGQLLKNYDELASLAKLNMDAVAQSGAVVADGVGQASRQVAAFTRDSLANSMVTGKALLTVKTIGDVMDVHHQFVLQSMEALVAETTRLHELSLKVAQDALAPLSARANATVDALARPVAA
jgi:phasin family protein